MCTSTSQFCLSFVKEGASLRAVEDTNKENQRQVKQEETSPSFEEISFQHPIRIVTSSRVKALRKKPRQLETFLDE
jgi:hypothetical protein